MPGRTGCVLLHLLFWEEGFASQNHLPGIDQRLGLQRLRQKSDSAMTKVAIIGGSGYTALELIKILLRHPHTEIVAVTSRQKNNPEVAALHPSLTGRIQRRCEPFDVDRLLAHGVECAFGCLPHGVSMSTLPALLDRGVRLIDLSADYRLRDPRSEERRVGKECRAWSLPDH